jgi:hypothetical protein
MATKFAGIDWDFAPMNVGGNAIPVPPVGNQEETGVFSMTR